MSMHETKRRTRRVHSRKFEAEAVKLVKDGGRACRAYKARSPRALNGRDRAFW